MSDSVPDEESSEPEPQDDGDAVRLALEMMERYGPEHARAFLLYIAATRLDAIVSHLTDGAMAVSHGIAEIAKGRDLQRQAAAQEHELAVKAIDERNAAADRVQAMQLATMSNAVREKEIDAWRHLADFDHARVQAAEVTRRWLAGTIAVMVIAGLGATSYTASPNYEGVAIVLGAAAALLKVVVGDPAELSVGDPRDHDGRSA